MYERKVKAKYWEKQIDKAACNSLATYKLADEISKLVVHLIKQNDKLQQDIEDMHDSHCTRFERCDKCKRLHDANYICPYCHHDNSKEEE